MKSYLPLKNKRMKTRYLPLPGVSITVLFSTLLLSCFTVLPSQAQRHRSNEATRDENNRRDPVTRPEHNNTRQDRPTRTPENINFQNPRHRTPSQPTVVHQNPTRIRQQEINRTPRTVNQSPVVQETRQERNTPRIEQRPNTTYNRQPNYATAQRPAYRPVYHHQARPVYNRYNPSWRYGWLPRRHSCYSSLPATYLTIHFGGIGYRYWNGVFYNHYNNLFTVIAPPVGIYINLLPVGHRKIFVRNYPYYYYNGTYYDYRENNYYVVSPPLGAVVESLPAGYETVVIEGETYYTADGAQYKPVVQSNGEIWYEVIKANN
jgi:Family of unknown function (DUF6515)